jgi:hypothetical protein
MKKLGFLFILAAIVSACGDYYEGNNYVQPRNDIRDRVVGSYDVEEFSNTYNDYVYYNINVWKDSYSSDVVYIDDFYVENLRIKAIVNSDRISIPYQVIQGYEVEGNGHVYRDELQLNYSVRDLHSNAFTDYCDTRAYRL